MSRINSSNSYRLEGPAISIAELAKTKPGLILAADDPRIKELNAHMAGVQAMLRAEVPAPPGARKADDNPAQSDEPKAASAQPKVTSVADDAAADSLAWELARSRMAFYELLKK